MSRSTDFIRRLLQLRVFLIVNLVILFFLSLSFGREWVRNASIEGQINDLQQEKATLESRNVELLSLGATIQTQYYLETEGRLKYGLRKPGEELVIVTPEDSAQTAPTEATTDGTVNATGDGQVASAVPVVGNAKRWWDYFFDQGGYRQLQAQYAD